MILIMLLAIISPKVFVNAADNPNLINNPSVETIVANKPANWFSNNWGTNTAEFTMVTPGNSGNTALRTVVTEYTNGDAKWYPEPVDVTPNETYIFSEHYRSNAPTNIVIQFTNTDGAHSYQWLQTAPITSAWAQLQNVVTIPGNVSKISIFHVVNTVGWLEFGARSCL